MSLMKDAAKYVREKHRDDQNFMKDRPHYKGLDFCFICPRLNNLSKGKC